MKWCRRASVGKVTTARAPFYTSFLGAFPDVHFDMYDVVIGPQGVFEVATLTGHA